MAAGGRTRRLGRSMAGWVARVAVARPRLTLSFALGVALALATRLVRPDLAWSTLVILGWDLTCIAFIAATMLAMRGARAETIRARAAREDEGQGFILGLVVLSAAASLAAIAVELSRPPSAGGLQALRVGLVLATVAASWFMIQLIFALHYAHEYFAPDAGAKGGGLAFPGGEAPDYWDFLHFSVVIGVAAQTADIAFTHKGLRRTGTAHSVVAFAYNTAVLALAINLLAGLF